VPPTVRGSDRAHPLAAAPHNGILAARRSQTALRSGRPIPRVRGDGSNPDRPDTGEPDRKHEPIRGDAVPLLSAPTLPSRSTSCRLNRIRHPRVVCEQSFVLPVEASTASSVCLRAQLDRGHYQGLNRLTVQYCSLIDEKSAESRASARGIERLPRFAMLLSNEEPVPCNISVVFRALLGLPVESRRRKPCP
jgi:hypothetical protein